MRQSAKRLESEDKIRFLRIEDLSPNQRNARIHPPQQIREISRSIKRFGFNNPILIDVDGQIIAGHGRVEAAKLLGIERVPTLQIAHLTSEEKRAYIIADNRLAEKAGWDREILAIEFQGLIDQDFDAQLTGFAMPEIEVILEEADPSGRKAEDDQIPDPTPDQIVTKLGDLWQLNEHRLLCADARHAASYATLLDGRRPQLIFVDPPYNVKVNGHVSGKGRVKHREFAQASGEKTAAQFTKFLDDCLGQLAEHSADGSIHFVCTDWRHLDEMLRAGRHVQKCRLETGRGKTPHAVRLGSIPVTETYQSRAKRRELRRFFCAAQIL
jgi:hypothetical protein